MDKRPDADIVYAGTGIVFDIAEMDTAACLRFKPIADQRKRAG